MQIEKWVYGGDGLARDNGRVVLTPFVLPGERARVEVVTEKADLVRTKLTEVVSAAADRVTAPCIYFQRCGGCQYQHAAYEFQVARKAEILREQLRRVGRIEFAGEIKTVAGEPFGYRNRSQFHLDGRRMGYYEGTSHKLLPIEQCLISSPKINATLAALRGMTRDPRFPNFIHEIELFTNETEVQINVQRTDRPLAQRFFDWCADEIPGMVPGPLDYAAAGGRFRVSGKSFFQVNRFLVDALVDAVLGDAKGASALDLYAGVGLFALKLARCFSPVWAVEQSGSAVEDLYWNIDRAGVKIQVAQKRVEEFLASAQASPDFVVADPPRAGLGKQVVERLVALKPRVVMLVSCDPATLARDLAVFAASGYRIEKLTMIDLFPQTYHMETVARLAPG
ncbi:MAG: class I SAM-dependent RNA methyltransferase [Bryobacteraceae bacterium]